MTNRYVAEKPTNIWPTMVDFTVPVFVSVLCTSALYSVSHISAGRSYHSIQKLPSDEPTKRGGYTDLSVSEILSRSFPFLFSLDVELYSGQCGK
jgi:Na+-driven multidrug efflux pump